ncbi:MAG: glycosyltransferase family 39 protein [ANME-2 cluster archaeon]|nr:glycosyltransferase family 39 protein [ANME-2 cluster archaeon]MDF1532414.1 glycosyltransferase family 39 protein [ANME-2 cluster archaeon]
MQVDAGKVKLRAIKMHHIQLSLILALSFVLQWYTLNWGLVTDTIGMNGLGAFHIIEPTLVHIPVQMMQTGDMNPHFFDEPSLFYNSMYVVFSVITGILGPLSFVEYIRIARLMTILLTVGVVFLTYLTANQICGRKVGLYAALFMSLNPYYLWFSSLAKEDPMMVFFLTLSLYFFVRYLRENDRRDYFISMVSAGLAVSTKYPAGMMLFFLPAWYFLSDQTEPVKERLETISKSIVLYAGAFVIGTPFSVLSFREFIQGSLGELGHYTTGHPGFEHFTWFVHVQTITGLWDAANIWGKNGYGLILILFLAGTGLLISRLRGTPDRSERFAWYCITGWIVLTVLVFGFMIKVKMGNQMMIMTPAAMIVSGYGFAALLNALPNIHLKRILGSVIVLLIFTYAASGIISSANDNRYYAAEWLTNNVPVNAKIATTLFVYVPDGFIDVSFLPTDAALLENPGYDYIILSSWDYERYLDSPDTYPGESVFYRMVLEGRTSYKPVASFERTETARQRTLNFGFGALTNPEYRGEVDIFIFQRT